MEQQAQTDVYFKKIIPFRYRRASLQFRVAQDLFSSFDIDLGTQLLLRTLADESFDRLRSVLDLGCGYGPIGLSLKKAVPDRTVCLVDRDALAVEYTRANAALNGIDDADVVGGLGYDAAPSRRFDLIVSNIPAKAGPAAIGRFVLGAGPHLTPDGMAAVVVITALEAQVAALLEVTPGILVTLHRTRPGHAVFHYRFTNDTGEERADDDLAIYRRDERAMTAHGLRYSIEAAHGLPEFDTLGHATDLLLESLRGLVPDRVRRALVLNPGQGHVPVYLARALRPAGIALVDRDLLALRVSERNLRRNGYAGGMTVRHAAGLGGEDGEPAELIAGVLREDEGRAPVAATVREATRRLADGGLLALAGSSTAITRVLEDLQGDAPLEVRTRARRRGQSAIVARPA